MQDFPQELVAPGATAPTPSRGDVRSITPASTPPQTSGERFYNRLQFITADAFIIAASAAIAYIAHPKFGRDSYFGIPNVLKKFQGGVNHFFMETLRLGKGGDFSKLVGGAASSMMLTMWGGNVFAPALKAFENNKEKIVTWYNRTHGTPEEVEAGHERLKDTPKQTWGDVIKGRLAGAVIVWSSFVGGYALLGKSKKLVTDTVTGQASAHYKIDLYEERVGRWFAGLSKTGKEIAATPMTQALTETQAAHRGYRLGRMVALDVFAASAALIIWNVIARASAKARANGKESKEAQEEQIPNVAADMLTEGQVTTSPRAMPEHPGSVIQKQTAQREATLAAVPEAQTAL